MTQDRASLRMSRRLPSRGIRLQDDRALLRTKRIHTAKRRSIMLFGFKWYHCLADFILVIVIFVIVLFVCWFCREVFASSLPFSS
jgi:hypothetical protein